MRSEITLTLVTPCYKTPKYFLERLLVSLGSFGDRIEWVLVDDSPKSSEVVDFARRAKRVMPNVVLVSHSKNLGITESYLSGFRAASGEYVGVLDHDDEVDLTDIFYALGNSVEYDLVYTNEAKFNHFWFEVYSKPNFDMLSAFYYYYPHHLTLFRTKVAREIIERNDILGVADTAFDIAFWCEYLYAHKAGGIRALALPISAYGWRMHHGSTASFIGQKPKHLEERRNISSTFARRFESSEFSIANREDVPYVIKGRFGLEYGEILDYIHKYFDCELVYFERGDIVRTSCLGQLPGVMSERLRSIPFGYVSSVSRATSLFIHTDEALRLVDSGHVAGVPYFAALPTEVEGSYIRLTDRRYRAERETWAEIVLAGVEQ